MLAPRFHCPIPLSVGLHFDLAPGVAKHACRVLRLRTGDDLVLFDGRGGDYAARITVLDRERVSVEVLGWRDTECEAPINVTLVQALQAGEKMDMTVQKAVELGVASIVPVITRRSVVRLDGERAMRRLEHWRGVAIAACEQCGRNRVPEWKRALGHLCQLRLLGGQSGTASCTLLPFDGTADSAVTDRFQGTADVAADRQTLRRICDTARR